MTDHEYETELAVRYRDLDPFGHVNNAVFATYCEQARVRFLGEYLDLPVVDPPYVVAHLSIDYRRPVEDVDAVSVGVDVIDVGTSSVRMAFEISADGDVAAEAETVIVRVNPESGDAEPVPDEWHRRLDASVESSQ